MVANSTVGEVVVDPSGERVTFDGEPLEGDPVDTVSLSRLYFL